MKINSILVSQPEPLNENSPYKRLKNKYNLKIHFRPFIHVEGISAKKVRLQKIDLNNFQNVILTSRNAVDHYFRISNEMRFKVPNSTKYFCQSEAVAFYLQKYVVYRKRKIYVGKKNIKDLKEIFEKFKNESYLLPTSNKLTSNVPKFLNKIELNWKRIQLYKTVVSDLSDLRDVYYDILVFFSPSGIDSLIKNFPDFVQNKTLIAAYGKSTIEAVNKANLKVNIQAPTKETPSMTMAIEKYLVNNKK
ncbi:MAG: uroporphyrinogen-III synthase [Flavobacteriaceae bacterium]|nr:uroporphyrinogen-III synthase [Flavobacteriaceae bacterium]|tara:strand:- start:18630 stop:19373 length:744 start_codon:yes stop_codon:yes gene_type:complete